ncbi:MAG: methylenetetrahydrofolate reductase [Candidatus Thorarchaeota archaeon]
MKILESGTFTVTCEIGPPRGADKTIVQERTRIVSDYCDAINITDNALGIPSMSSTACARVVLDTLAEPIMQLSTRDRNSIAIESELYGAYALGIRNVLFITGDDVNLGSHRNAKTVHDIDSIQALELASHLMRGTNLLGETLEGTPEFFLGATFNPNAEPLDIQVQRAQKKRDAGAKFFQSQAIFDTTGLEAFMDLARDLELKVLAGIIPLKGPKRASFMKNNVPGINIPEEFINRLEDAGKGLKDDEMLEAMREEGLLIATETIKAIRQIKGIRGVHLMGVGWEDSVPALVKRNGLYPRPKVR